MISEPDLRTRTGRPHPHTLQARESSRVLHYTDERLEGLSRRYEVEALRGEVGILRKDVAACLVVRNEGGGPELLAIAAAGAGHSVEPSGNRDMVC